jgi:hypothetical protein
MKRVLLSASDGDMALLRKPARVLAQRGVKVSECATDFTTRAKWTAVTKAMKNCDIVVVAFGSLLGLQTSGIGFVMGAAAALGKDVLVLAPDRIPRAAVPADISSWRMGLVDFDRPQAVADLILDQLLLTAA